MSPARTAAALLERVEHAGGLVTYRSPLLRAAGVTHAFTTRLGGVSRGVCAALNLSTTALGERVDEPERVDENLRRLRRALGVEELAIFRTAQVHGAAVEIAERARCASGPRPQADAIVSRDAGVICSVHVADCVPVLVARADGLAVAAIHAGWRGLVAGVVERAVEALRALADGSPNGLVAAVGPAISLERFEVGPEVAERFVALGLDAHVRAERSSRPRVDLPAVAAACLARAGVGPSRVDRSDRCTHRDADEFFSHRRDGGPTGRMAAWVVARGARGIGTR